MDTPMPPDLPERVAVLERLFERMDRRLDRIEQQLIDVPNRLENLSGSVAQLPTTWQFITYTLGAQVTLAGLLFAAFKLGHG
jgi:hypothetical protein